MKIKCPHCGNVTVQQMSFLSNSSAKERYIFQCQMCSQKFNLFDEKDIFFLSVHCACLIFIFAIFSLVSSIKILKIRNIPYSNDIVWIAVIAILLLTRILPPCLIQFFHNKYYFRRKKISEKIKRRSRLIQVMEVFLILAAFIIQKIL